MLQNPILLRLKKTVRDYCPSLLLLASRVASRTIMFRKERLYLKEGGKSYGNEPSVLFFSTFRCGTQRVDSILRQFCNLRKLQILNLGGYWFHRGVVREGEVTEKEKAEKLYAEKGYYFGRIRPIDEGFSLSSYKIISVVRDPRDVMVSFFYSFAYAHTPLNREFAKDAKEAREKGLEWFVSQPRRLKVIGDELRWILENTWNSGEGFYWKFEDMMSEFDLFLKELSVYLEIEKSSESLRQEILQDQCNAMSKGGSTLAHLRSGKKGEYKEKLSPDVVALLNEEFRDIIEGFGYEI